ncbi:MAG: hypothetical protein HYR76_11005 [Ignavibacteria bacterium]|nr:hypothetical protein [Ignavibacteria bacterium]
MGPQGPPGATGPQGPVGTANVQYSSWFSPSAWIADPNGSDFYFDTMASGITQSIIDSGVVLAYVKIAGDSVLVRPLPAIPTAQGIEAWDYVIPAVGKIRFTYVNNATMIPSTSNKFRYVIIPGGVKLGKRAVIDYRDYGALKHYYRIPD